MMKIKILDLKELIEKQTGGVYTISSESTRAIISGKSGFIVSTYEYVHTVKDLLSDSIRIYLKHNPANHNKVPFTKVEYIVMKLDDLLDQCVVTEVEPSDYFRSPSYNSRLKYNFSEFCESLKDIKYEHITEFKKLVNNRNQG